MSRTSNDERQGGAWSLTLAASGRVAWVTLAVWVVGLVVLFPLASEMDSVQSDSATDFLSTGAESTEVARIADSVEEDDSGQVMVVYRRAGGLTDADLALVERHRLDVTTGHGESSPLIPSGDGSAVFYVVSQPMVPEETDAEDAAAEFVTGVRGVVGGEHDGLTAQVTGSTAIEVDVDEVFDGVNTTLLLVTVAVVAVLLILTYRSPFLWLVPLVSVGVAAVVATAAVYLVASTAGLAVSTPNATIMIVLVFGAGTDYALLVVSRYREELRRHADRHDAMREALRRAAPVVLASGMTSSLGLLCLMAAQMNNIRGLGMVGSVGIAATTVTMLTFFPALLVMTGRGVFWPFVPRAGAVAGDGGRWSRLAGSVTRAPVRVLAGSTLVLGGLAVAVTTLPNELGQLDSFTTPAESVEGFQTLTAAYPEQGGRPVVIAAPADQESAALRMIADTPGVGQPEVEGRADGWVVIEADVAAMPDSDTETGTVLALRERIGQAPESGALVGGPAAERIDTTAALGDDIVVAIPLVLLVVFVILTVLLRAVIAPLLVVAAVVLSFGAALGIGAFAFAHLFGFAGAEPDLPMLCFVFLVALGVDYAIFLIARIRDNARSTDMASATRAALTVTGPVIVSAGVVLAATFAVLMTLPYVPMVQIGFVVAVGVLLESLVIPAMVVAPLAVRLNTRLWWPRSALRRRGAGEAASAENPSEERVEEVP